MQFCGRYNSCVRVAGCVSLQRSASVADSGPFKCRKSLNPFYKDFSMEYNDDNENNNENGQPPKLDPAGEVKTKIIFFVVAIVGLIIVKFALGL